MYCSSSTLPTPAALLGLCPILGWITASSSVPSVVTFSRTLMQQDITQLGSTRRATAKARTQSLWIYHPNKRPLLLEAMQEYIKLQHNNTTAGLLPTISFVVQEEKLYNSEICGKKSCFIHKLSVIAQLKTTRLHSDRHMSYAGDYVGVMGVLFNEREGLVTFTRDFHL